MFDQLKQTKQLYKLQSELKKEKITAEENGVVMTVNGKMEVDDVKLNPDISIEDQEKAVKSCFNEAMRKVQMIAAQKMQSMR
jgi:DNA-binding protein YbaB